MKKRKIIIITIAFITLVLAIVGAIIIKNNEDDNNQSSNNQKSESKTILILEYELRLEITLNKDGEVEKLKSIESESIIANDEIKGMTLKKALEKIYRTSMDNFYLTNTSSINITINSSGKDEYLKEAITYFEDKGLKVNADNKEDNNSNAEINYSENTRFDYKVCLKENVYYQESCIDSNSSYIASLINTIEAEFFYELNADNKTEHDYVYYIESSLIISDKQQGVELYKDDDKLLESKVSKSNTKTSSFKETIVIDYTKYARQAESFAKNYNLSLNANLKLTLIVKHSNKKISTSDEQKIEVIIPITEKTTDIKISN